jgi:hypothetical protein
MNNPTYKLLSATNSRVFRMGFAVLALLSIMAAPVFATSGSSNVICSIIAIYQTVSTAIFVIGLMLMILGGALYAGSHLMPGSSKGTMQGYGMGMVLGGVVGIVIAVLAPFILSVLTGGSVTGSNVSSVASNGITCP